MLRTALYARVSTEMQEKEQTIQSQLAAISQFAEAHGYFTNHALTYTDEGFSGTHLERPALDELRDHAREGRFEVLVVLCPDRLARKYAYQVLLLEEFTRAGVEVQFCERPISDSPDDQLLLQIQGAVAEYERAKILERARRGRLHRARLGELGPSKLPYGYCYTPKKYGGDGRIRIDEQEAALVRQVFNWYAQEGETLYGLLLKLNASSWYTRAGRKEWAATTVLRMLRCEWYIGRVFYNRTRSVRNTRSSSEPGKRVPKDIVTERPRAEWIAVPVAPVVDEDLFKLVQQRINDNRRFARRRLRRGGVFLLRGLMKCAICGHAYVAETRTESRRDGGIYRYEYYICTMRMAPLPDGIRHRCSNDRLRAVGVDEAVWTAVRNLLLDSDAVANQLRLWAEQSNGGSPELSKRLRHAEHRVREISQQQDRLLDAYQLGLVPLDAFKARMQTTQDNRVAAETALTQIRAEQLTADVAVARASGAEAIVQQLRPTLVDADFDTRQTIMRLLVERIVVHGQHLEVQLALPVSGNFGLTFKDHRAGQRLGATLNKEWFFTRLFLWEEKLMVSASTAPTVRSETLPRPALTTAPPAPATPGFIIRHPVLTYYVLTFAISWGGLLLVIIGGGSSIPATVDQFRRLIPFAIPFMLVGPSIAGMVMIGLVHGKPGYRELASRLLKWHVGVGWYAVALLTAPLVFAVVLLALSLTSPVFLPGIVTTSDKAAFLMTGIAAALMVGFFEELGWMGFAVPRLRLRHGVPSTGLIAGALWGAWHVLGNDLWGGPTGGGGAPYAEQFPLPVFLTATGLTLFVGQLPAFRVLMVWVYDRTGSLLVAMLMHASLDATTFILGPLAMSAATSFTYGIGVAVAMWVVVAAVVLATGGQFSQSAPDAGGMKGGSA